MRRFPNGEGVSKSNRRTLARWRFLVGAGVIVTEVHASENSEERETRG